MSQTKAKSPSLLGAIFLVSGTSIGAGMLAQPVAASLIGFIPSTLMMLIAWGFMVSTALILLEVALWMNKDTHIISMSSAMLGTAGKSVAWVIYLFIAYLSLTAYISGGGDVIGTASQNIGLGDFPEWVRCVFFVVFFGFVIEIGSNAVGKLNTILFVGLVVSYLLIVALGTEGIEPNNLLVMNFDKVYFILPLLLTSFSFQMIIPSLATYLDRDAKRLRIAIIVGTLLSFVIYTIWNAIVLGHISPTSGSSLAEAYAQGTPPIGALSQTEKQWFNLAVNYFAFFAIVTSFIGIAWGLFDFLADGLKVPKIGFNRVKLWLLVIVPPLLLALTYPRGFIGALESTGGFGDTILNGIIPVLMFWIGTRYLNKKTTLCLVGNRFYLICLLIFAAAVIVLEFSRQVGLA